MALNYGNFNVLMADKDIYAYVRTYLNNSVIVVFNKSAEEKEITLQLPSFIGKKMFSAEFSSEFSVENSAITVKVKPNFFEILVGK